MRARQDSPSGAPRWLALDGAALFRAGVAASERYNTRIEDSLARRLGVEFSARADSVRTEKRVIREICGVPPELIKHFSKRRKAIEDRTSELLREYRHTHGKAASAAVEFKIAQQATLDTRDGKPEPRSLRAQISEWREEAVRVLGPSVLDDIRRVVGHPSDVAGPESVPLDALAASVVETMEGERATWTQLHVIAEVERQSRGLRFGTGVQRERIVQAITERATSSKLAVRIDPATTTPLSQRTIRFTTQRILDAEGLLLAAAQESVRPKVSRASAATTMSPVASLSGTRMDAGQAALATAFTTMDRQLVVGIGPAGSGKTTAMRAAFATWDANRIRVIPLATSSVACR